METVTINISLSQELLALVDKQAKREFRNRSELIREALRSYIRTQDEFEDLYRYGAAQAAKLNIKPEDVNRLIAEYRAGK